MFGWVPSRPSSYWNDIHQGTSAGSDSFVRAPWSCPGVLASRTVRGKLCHRSSKSWWNLMEFYGSSMELWDSRKYWNSMIFYVKRHVYSLEFSWLLKILMNFHEFSGILMNSHDISWILEQYNKKNTTSNHCIFESRLGSRLPGSFWGFMAASCAPQQLVSWWKWVAFNVVQ